MRVEFPTISKELNESQTVSFPNDSSKAIMEEPKKAEATNIEPSDYERIGAGLGEFQAGFRENIASPIASILGMDETSSELLNKANKQKEYAEYIKTQTSDHTIQTIGSIAPEFAIGAMQQAKTLGQGVLEFGLSYSRSGDAGTAMRDSVIAMGIGKAFDKVLNGKTQTGKAVDNLATKDERNTVNKILDNLETKGSPYINEEARTVILNSITPSKSNKEISDQVLSTLVKMKSKARDVKNEIYNKAHIIADTTPPIDSRESIQKVLIDQNGQVLTPQQLNIDEEKAYQKISMELSRNSTVSAKGIEEKLQRLKKMEKADADDVSYLYTRAIEDLQAKQNLQLEQIGKPDLYKPAREADMAYKRDYIGNIDGYGSTGGKNINSVIKAKDNFDTSKALLNGDINPNLADQIGRSFDTETKREMLMDVLIDGIDTSSLDSREGVTALLANFGKMNPTGVKRLVGGKIYNNLKTDMETLGFIQGRLDDLSKQDQDIAKDVLNLIAGVGAFKVSPFASVHVAINSSKSIANKKILKSKAQQLTKRVKTMSDNGIKRRILNGINMSMSPYLGDIVTPFVLKEDINTKEGLNKLAE